MCAGIRIEGAKTVYINGMKIDGCDIGLDVKDVNKLIVKEGITNHCDIGINLDSCGDSDIKDVCIRNRSYQFSYTLLALSIMLAIKAV